GPVAPFGDRRIDLAPAIAAVGDERHAEQREQDAHDAVEQLRATADPRHQPARAEADREARETGAPPRQVGALARQTCAPAGIYLLFALRARPGARSLAGGHRLRRREQLERSQDTVVVRVALGLDDVPVA